MARKVRKAPANYESRLSKLFVVKDHVVEDLVPLDEVYRNLLKKGDGDAPRHQER